MLSMEWSRCLSCYGHADRYHVYDSTPASPAVSRSAMLPRGALRRCPSGSPCASTITRPAFLGCAPGGAHRCVLSAHGVMIILREHGRLQRLTVNCNICAFQARQTPWVLVALCDSEQISFSRRAASFERGISNLPEWNDIIHIFLRQLTIPGGKPSKAVSSVRGHGCENF